MKITQEEHEARQRALYKYLIKRGDKWTPMRKATDSVNLYPTFYTGNYHNSWARRLLTKDIKYINDSDAYSKVIVSGDRGIKIANKADLDRFISAETKEIFKKLATVRKVAKKGSRDQQIDLEGRIYEAFLDGSNG